MPFKSFVRMFLADVDEKLPAPCKENGFGYPDLSPEEGRRVQKVKDARDEWVKETES